MAAVPEYDEAFPPPEGEEAAPLPEKFSEDHLASHWVKRHGEHWRYVQTWGAWYRWTGDHWHQEKTQEAFDLARNMTREALTWEGCTKQIRSRVNSARTAAAMLQFVKADRKIAATHEQWDTNRMLLGVPGGTVDLNICKFLPAEPDQYITKLTAVTPAKGAPERWLKFLSEVTNGQKDIIDYLQRFAGYCLTGETSEHALAFLYGTGANGKTTLVQTILGILGDYAITAPMETFAESKNERHSTELARLRGARLVATEETSSGSRWNESRIKTLTGGNRISAHYMRQDDFEFQPEFKLLIAGNHKPQMRSVDEAMKRRIHIVPFTVTIPEEERDPHLHDALKKEWPQILNWMIEGCAAWRDYRLAAPEVVKDATNAYLKSNDILGNWLEECCDREGWASSKSLYGSFAAWAEEQGERVWSRRAWADAMGDNGFQPGRARESGSQERGFHGVKLRVGISTASQQYPEKSYGYDA